MGCLFFEEISGSTKVNDGSIESQALCLSGSLHGETGAERIARVQGGEHRAGLVGDQMSSQWGRNDEGRKGGREEVWKGVFSAVAPPCMMLLNMMINHTFIPQNSDDERNALYFT